MTRWTALFCVFAFYANVLHADERYLMESLDNTRVIKEGDLLGILILHGTVVPVEERVSDNGEVKPPFLEPMKAAGLTCRKLAFQIEREMEKNFFGSHPVLVKFVPDSFKELMSFLNDQKVIQPGDKLWLRVIESRRDAEDYEVPKDGVINIPYLGPIKVAGLTCKKFAHLISQQLAALPTKSLPFKCSGPPAVAVAFKVVMKPDATPYKIPAALR